MQLNVLTVVIQKEGAFGIIITRPQLKHQHKLVLVSLSC